MYAVKFSKLKNDHNRLRTDEILGKTQELPQVGKQFVLFGEGLEFGTRCVNTSPVKSVERHQPDLFVITTESGSIYNVQVLGVLNELKTNEK